MCGIAGIAFGGALPRDQLIERIVPMTRQLALRGPDGEGFWLDSGIGLALGHRRLSVIDLSVAGDQPMTSSSKRYTVTYNGEAYNFKELRRRLEIEGLQPAWRGYSDTEVLLASFDAWGVVPTLQLINGMFALAVWDSARRVIYLARDRFGEKPLYYGKIGKAFLFGSQLKALTAYPGWESVVDEVALRAYTRYNFVPGPLSIYKGVSKLLPGRYVEVALGTDGFVAVGDQIGFWSAEYAAHAAHQRLFSNPNEAIEEVERTLSEAVRIRMESDVPLGALLSGGIDSSIIVAMMQKHSSGRTRSFTIASDDPRMDESSYAAAVAKHLGCQHTEFRVSAEQVISCVPGIAQLYDEPFADSSQIPTFLIAREARKYVTVALTGDGGDELFGGYNRYFIAEGVWRRMQPLPAWLRKSIAALLQMPSPAAWDRFALRIRRVLGRRRLFGVSGDRIYKLCAALKAGGLAELYESLLINESDLSTPAIVGDPLRARIRDASSWPVGWSGAEAMMMLDVNGVLPDDFLVKVDRASMGVSLETRAPFLDVNLFSSAWRLPDAMRFSGGSGKWLLRQVAYRHVPRKLLDRPKQGFSVPVDEWLRGPLKSWARDRLGNLSSSSDYPGAETIMTDWQQHQQGTVNRTQTLWNAVMYSEWNASLSEPSAARAEPPQNVIGQ